MLRQRLVRLKHACCPPSRRHLDRKRADCSHLNGQLGAGYPSRCANPLHRGSSEALIQPRLEQVLRQINADENHLAELGFTR
jgi:hypothetical protein